MLPEIRVLIQRAEMRRASFEGLLEAVPGNYWERRAQADEWSAVEHLRHVATIDDLLIELLQQVEARLREVLLGGGAGTAPDDPRVGAMRSVEALSVEELVGRMRGSRQRAVRRIGRLDADALETSVLTRDAVDAWGTPLRWPLRSYLAAWVGHDDVHADAIRQAVSTPPDLSAVMLARKHRRDE